MNKKQIYEYIKEEIMQGRLSYREKLPSARELAASLLVSRNPVDTAYEQLVAEGYVYAVAQKGYYVNEITYIREYSEQKEDSPAPEETTILAVCTGTVTFASWGAGGGYTIVVENDNIKVSYCHVSPNFIVQKNDIVTAGQIIGNVGPKNVYGIINNP